MLRDAREARGLTLDDLARTTKVGKATLIALEASDVLRLPAAIYTRGFVRAYAGEVGLDPDRTADTYVRYIQPLTIHHSSVDDGVLPPLLEAPGTATADMGTRQRLMGNQSRRFGRVATVAAVICLIVYLVSFGRQRDRQVAPALTPLPTAVDAATVSAPATASTTTAGGPEAVTATPTGPLQIELNPQGPCWLAATVDGERVLARLLQPGERQTLAVSEEAVLRIGDPSVLTISINGLSGRTLGRPGQPVSVTITKENFRDFLSS